MSTWLTPVFNRPFLFLPTLFFSWISLVGQPTLVITTSGFGDFWFDIRSDTSPQPAEPAGSFPSWWTYGDVRVPAVRKTMVFTRCPPLLPPSFNFDLSRRERDTRYHVQWKNKADTVPHRAQFLCNCYFCILPYSYGIILVHFTSPHCYVCFLFFLSPSQFLLFPV